jgi:hypothetical protein
MPSGAGRFSGPAALPRQGGETTPPGHRPAGVARRLRRRGPAAGRPDREKLVGTADVERLLVSTQKRKSPKLRVGTASCPDQVRLANGTRFTCTVRIEGATAPYAVTSATSTPPGQEAASPSNRPSRSSTSPASSA